MKRIIILLFIFSFAFGKCLSQPVSKEEALKRAAAFLKARGRKVLPDEMNLAYRGKRNAQDIDTSYASYYVFNNPLNKGFIIMSGDNRAQQVIAYSDSGAFTEKNMPDHLRFWMDSYSSQISGAGKVSTGNSPIARGETPMVSAAFDGQRISIPPLIKTEWRQDSPFSDLCPTYNARQCVTGCLATALAQLMYYHKWPQDFTTSIPGFHAEFINSDIPPLNPVLFNWEDMKLKYNWEETDGNAVATLLEYCANSLKMNYRPGSSSAYTYLAAQVLKKYFKYDPNLQYVRKETKGYSDEQWEQMIYNELVEGRPVVFAGQASDMTGHAFVCDGYDNKTGLFHVNWGWGGLYDGYFGLTILKPEGNKGIGSSIQNDGYNIDQEAIIGIQPPTDKIVENTAYLTSLFTEVGHGKITANYYNRNERKRHFRYGIGIWESDTIRPIKTFRSDEPLDKNQPLKGCVFDLKQLLKKPGKYRVVPISRQENHTSWRRGRSYADVTVSKNGSISIKRHNRLALRVTQIALASKRKAGIRQNFKVTLCNEFDNYKGALYLFASEDSIQQGSPLDRKLVSVSGGESTVADMSFLPMNEGRYYLWFSTDKKGNRVIRKAHLDIGK
jgi:hypothetical protein